MSAQDTTERLKRILDLALMANPWASMNTYRDHLLERFHDFPQLAFVAVDRRQGIVGIAMGEAKRKMGEVEDVAVMRPC